MKVFSTTIAFFCFLTAQAQSTSSELTVRVENVKSLEGKIMLGLFNDKAMFLENAMMGGGKQIDNSVITFNFKGLEQGTYAVSIFHDENSNGELDANFLGIPKEPYAFSNNAKGYFGPPSFEQCKFEVAAERKEIVISL